MYKLKNVKKQKYKKGEFLHSFVIFLYKNLLTCKCD